MEISYRQLKANGESVVLERQEDIVVERRESKIIKRKQTIVREKFPLPATTESKQERRSKALFVPLLKIGKSEQHKSKSATTGESHRAARQQKLTKLTSDIDSEIVKLRQEREQLLRSKKPPPKTVKVKRRSVAVQSDATWEEQDFSATRANIEFTIEKYSSQHKFVCTSPRYARDEQTWCRPRMRTIGLQKNLQRSSSNLKINSSKKNNSADNCCKQKQLEATLPAEKDAKNPILPIPAMPFSCFDCGCDCSNCPTNAAINLYHMQCQLQKCNCNQNCHKVCQRYNMSGNYNGVICNQNRYLERGVSPCNEYNYCCDEYTYNCPHNAPQPATAICCSPPPLALPHPCCPAHCNCSRARSAPPRSGRQQTDLETATFYVPSRSATKSRSSKSPTDKNRDDKVMKKYMLSIMKRKQKHHYGSGDEKNKEAAKSKAKRGSKNDAAGTPKKERDDSLWEEDYRKKLRKENAAKIAKKLTRRSQSDDKSSGSEEDPSSMRKVSSEEKLLKITLTKQKHHAGGQNFRPCDCECARHARSAPDYSGEVLDTFKKMRISTYEPIIPRLREYDDDTKHTKHKRSSRSKQSDDDREAGATSRRGDAHKKRTSPDKYSDEEGEAGAAARQKRAGRGKQDDEDAAEDGTVGKEKKYAEYINQYKQGAIPEELDIAERIKTESGGPAGPAGHAKGAGVAEQTSRTYDSHAQAYHAGASPTDIRAEAQAYGSPTNLRPDGQRYASPTNLQAQLQIKSAEGRMATPTIHSPTRIASDELHRGEGRTAHGLAISAEGFLPKQQQQQSAQGGPATGYGKSDPTRLYAPGAGPQHTTADAMGADYENLSPEAYLKSQYQLNPTGQQPGMKQYGMQDPEYSDSGRPYTAGSRPQHATADRMGGDYDNLSPQQQQQRMKQYGEYSDNGRPYAAGAKTQYASDAEEIDWDGAEERGYARPKVKTGKSVNSYASAYATDDSSWETVRTCSTGRENDLCTCNQKSQSALSHCNVPEFIACPCMLDTYLKIVSEYCDDKRAKKNPNARTAVDSRC